jgi:hypothetical protein
VVRPLEPAPQASIKKVKDVVSTGISIPEHWPVSSFGRLFDHSNHASIPKVRDVIADRLSLSDLSRGLGGHKSRWNEEPDVLCALTPYLAILSRKNVEKCWFMLIYTAYTANPYHLVHQRGFSRNTALHRRKRILTR